MMRHGRYAVLAVMLLGSALAGGLLTLLALGSVASVHSQPTFPDGAFVQGQDGTRWVVGSGLRFRMAFVGDDAGLLPGLRDGGIVASVCEAAAALAGTDPAACGVVRPVSVTPATPPFAPPAPPPFTPPVVPPVTFPAPPSPESTLLLDAGGGATTTLPGPVPGSGPGSVVTQPFVNSAPRELELCWEVPDPTTPTAYAGFTIWEWAADGTRATSFAVPFTQQNGCRTFPGQLLPAGTYVVHVTSSLPFWRVFVRVR